MNTIPGDWKAQDSYTHMRLSRLGFEFVDLLDHIKMHISNAFVYCFNEE